ncbi:invasion associated locus B family protein [Methylobacterium planeticum]|uniref:Invasion associated locus B family protein n=1 Tax=Methylobacterium planeticum TaxID=2615211 RepID=A0A6N6MWF7_9HYPH|nr:invasion associated locus B family protein [Methylobacterium planeticum]KAB1076237.1 invasion associated locus B family protein [Methylobacterium planeticum]
MPPLRGIRPFAALIALGVLAAAPARAQEEAPAAPEAAPKPKLAPRKPPPKPAAKAEPKPDAKSEAKPTTAAAVWPVGASAVSETYGDWTVNCVRETETQCNIVQTQGDAKTGRRQFAFELKAPKDGRSEGLILMPFGQSIEAGVSFTLDETALGKGAPYLTCGPEGCYVPISFPTLATDAMKTAQKLTVTAQKREGAEPTVITVPLNGFAAALARVIAFGS